MKQEIEISNVEKGEQEHVDITGTMGGSDTHNHTPVSTELHRTRHFWIVVGLLVRVLVAIAIGLGVYFGAVRTSPAPPM
jgi:hypothetical protein